MPTMVESTTRDPTQDEGFSGDAEISRFLSRPIEIQTFEWNPGTNVGATFDVWPMFVNSTAVQDKLNNYKLLRGKLVLTFSINGTPFHAGKILAAWKYMGKDNHATTILGRMCQFTQLDYHMWLDAPTSKGGCMCIPFVFPENYLDLQQASHTPGILHVLSPVTLSQNDSGADPVSVTIFAHLTDVKLTVPTSRGAAMSGPSTETLSLPILGWECAKKKKKEPEFFSEANIPVYDSDYVTDEGGDEYAQAGPVEKVAAATAMTAEKLSEVPIIGPFASAVKIGASAVEGVANVFGWSKPRIIDDPKPMRNTPLANMASGDGGSQSQSLALTQKQGITVDPGICNETSEDTLTVASLAQRESMYTTFNWDPTDDVNDYIFATNVMPCLYRANETDVGEIVPTATHYASLPAGYWGGSLKFRFQFVCSSMHKGKIAIIHDPSGIVNNSFDVYNTTRCTIVNLAENTDITIVVPWAQTTTFLPNDRKHLNIAVSQWTAVTPTALTILPESNGGLYIKVLNKLTVSDGATPVRVLVSVSAGDDFKLGNTLGVPETMMFHPASATSVESLPLPILGWEASMNVDKQDVVVNDAPVADPSTITDLAETSTTDHTYEVYFGEPYLSIRPLLKRSVVWRLQKMAGASSATAFAIYSQKLPAVPLYRGYSVAGIDENDAGTALFNQVLTVPYHYTAQMFAGWRGSIRYQLTPLESSSGSAIFVNRSVEQNFASGDFSAVPDVEDFAMTTSIQNAAERVTDFVGTMSGMFGTNRNMLNADFELPYARQFRFSLTDTSTLFSTDFNNYGSFGYLWKWFYASGTTYHPATTLVINTSCGEDMQFIGFAGTPIYYVDQGS